MPTLAQLQASPRARRKDQLPTKLDRAIAAKAARVLDAKLLRAWALKVKTRDLWKDRRTGKQVKSTRSLDPDRAEAHHLASRDDWAVRYDVRNGVCLSLRTHLLVSTGKLRVDGTAFFTVGGTRYIDATYDLKFVRA